MLPQWFTAKTFWAFILSLSIGFSGYAPFIGPRAVADQSSQDLELKSDQLLEEIRQSILDPLKHAAHLDIFYLLRQEVVDERKIFIEALEKDAIREDYNLRINNLREQQKQLREMKEKVQKRLQEITVQEPAYQELAFILSDIDSRLKLVDLELVDLQTFDPQKGNNKLPVELMIDKKLKPRRFLGDNIKIRLERGQEILGFLAQKDFQNSISPRFSHSGFEFGEMNTTSFDKSVAEIPMTFSLTTHKGEIIHRFHIPVQQVLFWGAFLVIQEEGKRSLRFIDLEYFRPNLGNAPLPIFELPLGNVDPQTKLQIDSGDLKWGELRLSYPQLSLIASTQRLIFNVQVALSDAKSYESSKVLLQEIVHYLQLSLAQQDRLFQTQISEKLAYPEYLKKQLNELDLIPHPQKFQEAQQILEQALKDARLSEEDWRRFDDLVNSRKLLLETNQALSLGKKWTVRLELWFRHLFQPRPLGSITLLENLILLGSKSTFEQGWLMLQQKIPWAAIKKYGLGMSALVAANYLLPESYQLHLYQVQDLISHIWAHYKGYLEHIQYGKAYYDLVKDAYVTSTSGWTYFISSYLSDGKWTKFLVGLGHVLLVPLQLFATIHVFSNAWKLSKLSWRELKNEAGEKSFVRAFIDAVNADQKAYWDSLAEAEKKVSGSDVTQVKPEEVELLLAHLQRLQEGRVDIKVLEKEIAQEKKIVRWSFKKVFEQVKSSLSLQRSAEDIGNQVEQAASHLKMKNAESFLGALWQGLVSYSALRTTFRVNATIWNYLFMTRSYVFTPSKWFMFLIYPDYFRVTVESVKGQQHLPSIYNGGLKLWPEKIYLGLSRWVNQFPPMKKNLPESWFIQEEFLKNLNLFENYILDVEKVAIEWAKAEAQKALIESIKDPRRVMELFNSVSSTGSVSTGIQNLHDSKLKELTAHERLYYQAVFVRTFDISMQKLITRFYKLDDSFSGLSPDEFAKAFRQALLKGQIETIALDAKTIEQVKTELVTSGELPVAEIRAWAEQVKSSFSKWLDQVNIQFRMKLLESIYPNNPQVRRFLLAKQKIQEPRAMERAMRMEVSHMLTSIPMGILFTLSLYAGVQTGLLQPFDPNSLNTETHFMYMSKYLFYNGFIPGLIIGLMANTWMKVQEDARIDSLGGFSKVIGYADGQKSFWRYYLKNVWKNPANKWLDNHVYMLKLITANIPAAAVTIIVSNLYGLGRIDIGSFIASYIMIYVTFLSGMNVKLNQAFELASSWVYNKIPRKLRALPEAQRYINLEIQKRKNIFSLLENFWQVVVVENIAGTMLTLKDNVQYGTRAFLRMVFGGDTPTQIVVHFVDRLIAALNRIPGFVEAAQFFKELISKNYEAFERYPDRLGLPPSGVERVIENPHLPQSFWGEFLGKLLGMTSTLGAVAATPYVLSSLNEEREEKERLQAGQKIIHQQAVRCELLFSP